MQPYKPSSSALLDGVSDLERFFASYKTDILSSLRGTQQLSPTRFHRKQVERRAQSEEPAATDPHASTAAAASHADDDDARQEQQQHQSTENSRMTARELHRTSIEDEQFNMRLLGSDFGVVDVISHLFSRHGTSHTLLDAIEHMDLLVPNWHEPRKDEKGELLETPKMRVLALRTTAAAAAAAAASHDPSSSPSSSSAAAAAATMAAADELLAQGSGGEKHSRKNSKSKWKKEYSVADVCDLTGLKDDFTVVRLLERDRGFGTKLWKVQTAVDEDCAPGMQQSDPGARFTGTSASGTDTKKPAGWRSRLKFATALRDIQDREFVPPEAREAVRHLEQIVLPTCSFEPSDLVAMSNALHSKLVYDADKATRDEMIHDLQQQIRAIESFVRSLEADQGKMAAEGEMAQLRAAAVQQLEWYERMLKACENQFDLACDDVKSVEEARKQRHWAIFRSSRGDLPAVQRRVHARIARLQSSADKVRDMLQERAAVYEADLKQLDGDIVASSTSCVQHLSSLRGAWDELLDALRKAAAAEKKFVELGASLRSTVEDRLDLLGARALKDRSHASLLKCANDVMVDFAGEVERLQNSKDLLSELHGIACSGSGNITQQFDARRAELLKQAEELRAQHELWMQEYSVALGRHRHRISTQLSDTEEVERSAEMRREMGSDLLDFQTRAHAMARDEAATNKVKLRAELAALDGSFHSRNDAFRNRGVSLNLLRQFVRELQAQADNAREGKGGLLDPERMERERAEKKKQDRGRELNDDETSQQSRMKDNVHDEGGDDASQERQRRANEAPLYDTTNIDLVNVTSLHHLEKHVRNRFEAAGHSRQEQIAREVQWEQDRIAQAKEATRVVRRMPLGPVSVASSPPPFLSPKPPPQHQPSAGNWGAAPRRPGSAAVLPSAGRYIGAAAAPAAAEGVRGHAPSPVNDIGVTTAASAGAPAASSSSSFATTRPQTAPALRTRTGGKVVAGQCLRVVFPFEPRVEDELKLQRGDSVIVLRSGEDAGWVFGVCGDKMGQFPLNYCDSTPY